MTHECGGLEIIVLSAVTPCGDEAVLSLSSRYLQKTLSSSAVTVLLPAAIGRRKHTADREFFLGMSSIPYRR